MASIRYMYYIHKEVILYWIQRAHFIKLQIKHKYTVRTITEYVRFSPLKHLARLL
jgi:hypothetical protein